MFPEPAETRVIAEASQNGGVFLCFVSSYKKLPSSLGLGRRRSSFAGETWATLAALNKRTDKNEEIIKADVTEPSWSS